MKNHKQKLIPRTAACLVSKVDNIRLSCQDAGLSISIPRVLLYTNIAKKWKSQTEYTNTQSSEKSWYIDMANNVEKLENMDKERGEEKPKGKDKEEKQPLEFKDIKEIKERQPNSKGDKVYQSVRQDIALREKQRSKVTVKNMRDVTTVSFDIKQFKL